MFFWSSSDLFGTDKNFDKASHIAEETLFMMIDKVQEEAKIQRYKSYRSDVLC